VDVYLFDSQIPCNTAGMLSASTTEDV